MTIRDRGVPRLYGAEGAHELLDILAGKASEHLIARESDGRTARLRVSSPSMPDTVLQRYELSWQEEERRRELPAGPLFPAGTLVVLDEHAPVPEGMPDDAVVLRFDDTGWWLDGRQLTDGEELLAMLAGRSYQHVRVVATLEPWHDWLARESAPEAVLRLHDACFLTAKAAVGLETYGIVLAGGADGNGAVHPYAGLFTGLVKALELEPVLTTARFCVVLTAEKAGAAIAQLAEEMRVRHALPGVVLGDHQRRVQRARLAPVPPARGPVLGPDAIVLGAGTSRGIGMLTLLALAETCRPVIHILGTNDLSLYENEELTEDDEAHRFRRRAVLVAAARGENGGIPAVNARLRRLSQAREVHVSLARLTALCGEGKVHYHVCDSGDPVQVRQVAEEVLATHGGRPVDLLLNFSGLIRSAELPAKTLENFRAVRDIKVDTYHALKHAFAEKPPLRWVNAGSGAGLFGIQGETDYAAANDFLYTAAGVSEGTVETTFGWGLWDGTTRSTEPLVAEVLDRHLSRMPVEEGIAHFLAELSRTEAVPTLAYFGAVERRVMGERRPRRTAIWAAAERESEPEPPFDEIIERGPRNLSAYRDFDIGRDSYLEHHLVGGHPTVPGMVALELAAQAAKALVPGRVPVGVRDLVLDRFIRVFRSSARPQRKKIVAEIEEDVPGEYGETLVGVRILTDVVAPDGTVLATDREHCRMSVVLRDRPRECPRPAADRLPRAAGAQELANPYQLPNPFIELSGIFAANKQVQAGPEGKLATMTLDAREVGRWFEHAALPSAACDALAQVMATTAQDGWSPVAVPRTVRRIDFYGGLNDVALAGEELTLRATSGPDTGLWGAVFAADGRLVLRIAGATGEVLGYVHQESGLVRTVDEHPVPPTPPEIRPAEEGEENEPAVRPHLVAYDTTSFARPVQRWVTEPVPCPMEPVSGGLRGRRLLLLGAHARTTEAVMEQLTACGAIVTTAGSSARMNELSAEAPEWDVIVDLTLTGLPDYELGDGAWREALSTTTAALQAVYDHWLGSARADRFQYLTVGHGDGLFGRSGTEVPQPLAGAWGAMARNLMIELPGLVTKSIDLDRADPAEIARVLDIEAGSPGQQEVGYRDSVRHVQRVLITASLPDPTSEPPAGPGDCVLISGGGRGVGFALAEELARLGADVVVTGRRALTGPGAELDDAGFSAWRKSRLLEAAGSASAVREGLRAVEDAEFVRTALANLAVAAGRGARIRYEPCDVTDRNQVERLVAGLEQSPTVLVHNAATYRGVRFSRLSPEEVVRAVEVKVTGFATLFDAVSARASTERPLRFVSCAGSMSASGGMVGHTAYAAGSGALSRLGLWAARRSGVPIHTVSWPTWERTGNIVHYLGAARYGSTMDPVEGTTHWLAEMAEVSRNPGHGGESGYFGRLGVMSRPHHLRAMAWPAGSPDRPRVETGLVFLGEVDRFVEHARFRTSHRWFMSEHPHLGGGELSVPMLLEYVLSAGDWVRPEGHPRQHLLSVSDVDIQLARLRPDGESLALEFDASGGWADNVWQVRVTVTGDLGPVATAVLEYGERPPEPSSVPEGPLTAVRAHADEDLWCGTPTPAACLPHPALSAILAAAAPVGRVPDELRIARLVAVPGCRGARFVRTGTSRGSAVLDGRAVLELHGIDH